MKVTAAIGTFIFTLSTAVNAAVTGNCTPGMNYCQSVLDDVGKFKLLLIPLRIPDKVN